jgi:FkbM family methyltransferase
MTLKVPTAVSLKECANALHRRLAHAPRWLVRAYFEVISLVSRNLLPRAVQRRVRNSLCGYGYRWPEMSFRPRRVVLGSSVEVRLVPHPGEFDEEALFSRTLEYEPAVFAWLETHAGDYDTILEIGANVGVYTVFLDALARRGGGGGRPRLVAYEPSPAAFRRLERNLAANGAAVQHLQAAVGLESGQQTFYEPVGHLTNGSFDRAFAAQFSDRITTTIVKVEAAADLARWLETSHRTLIKLDVEGFEPQLLAALAPLLLRFRPDLLIEVLPGTPEALAANEALAHYDKFLVTADGPRRQEKMYFSQENFDWLLTWRAKESGRETRPLSSVDFQAARRAPEPRS